MTRKGEQYQQELQEKECALEKLATSNDGRERLSGDRGEDDGNCSPRGNEGEAERRHKERGRDCDLEVGTDGGHAVSPDATDGSTRGGQEW
jgi:hypothetical protein